MFMQWLRRAVVPLFTVALLLTNVGCGADQEMPRTSRQAITVSVGMPVDELRQRSSYEFGEDPSANAASIGAYTVSGPFDLEYIIGSDRLTLENIGDESLQTFIVINDGKVNNLHITPQRGGLTLDEAIEKAGELSDWFIGAGFAERTSYGIWSMRGGVTEPDVSSLDEARGILADPDLLVARMNLFSGDRDGLSAGIAIANGRRMRALAGSEDDAVDRDAAANQEWILEIVIVPATAVPDQQ